MFLTSVGFQPHVSYNSLFIENVQSLERINDTYGKQDEQSHMQIYRHTAMTAKPGTSKSICNSFFQRSSQPRMKNSSVNDKMGRVIHNIK